MGTHKYRVYYEWQGKSVDDILATEKTQDEVDDAFQFFSGELASRLEDATDETFRKSGSAGAREIEVKITTTSPDEVVQAELDKTLKHWRLFADKIP